MILIGWTKTAENRCDPFTLDIHQQYFPRIHTIIMVISDSLLLYNRNVTQIFFVSSEVVHLCTTQLIGAHWFDQHLMHVARHGSFVHVHKVRLCDLHCLKVVTRW